MLLVGCVKNEPLTPDLREAKAEIAFECPLVAPKLKSVAEVTEYPANLDFKVWGFFSEGTVPEVVDNLVQHKYIPGVAFTQQGGLWGAAGGADKYYWPTSGYLNFFAYAPASPKGNPSSTTITGRGMLIKNYTVPDEADEDLMVSRAAIAQEKPLDQSIGSPLLFDHVLTSLMFNVRSGVYGDRSEPDPDPERIDTDIRVTKVEVLGLYAKGNFSQLIADWNADLQTDVSTWRWFEYDNSVRKDYVAYDQTYTPLEPVGEPGQPAVGDWEAGTLLTGEYQALHDRTLSPEEEDYLSLTNLIVLPQTIPDDAVLRVTYDMTHSTFAGVNGADTPLWILDRVATKPLKECGVTSWNLGCRYTYNITIGLNKIECTTYMTDWPDDLQKESGTSSEDFSNDFVGWDDGGDIQASGTVMEDMYWGNEDASW